MKYLRFLGNELLLGALIAILSVFTALSSYQSSLAGGEQNNAEIKGMQSLNDGNAEYLTENQNIGQDYNYYDNWYLNQTSNPDVAEYYQNDFSQQLQDAIARDPNNVWDEQYYTEMAATSTELFSASEAYFKLASDWNERGDKLQLVVMIMALGVAFAAWASLLKEESNLRMVFSFFAIAMLIFGLITYLGVPSVAVAV
ncbi:MAG: hypothetical protein PHQ36_04880 [Anaerolineales bacterium]|nr:hypothetical protein [Anaerolineales bacterium]